MTNSVLILLTQEFPTRLRDFKRRIWTMLSKPRMEGVAILENIDHFPTISPKQRHALLALSPDAWLAAVREYPNIRLFNYIGLTYEIVRSLNENGYVVDIVDKNHEGPPIKHYDLFVAHGGKCRTILDNLPAATPVLQYVSGVHWRTFNEESAERYRSFSERKNVRMPDAFRRSFGDLIEGEEYLTSKATALFTIHCPRMIASYGEYQSKFFYTGLGAYPDDRLKPDGDRDFDKGRTNFLYVGGTGGNIQKGLDVIIDAFSRHSDLNLYIYCKVEPEIIRHCKRELNLPNIHYIYHWRHSIFKKRLSRLLRNLNFTIHAPINAGLGTAFMASIGAGLIPVGYIDYTGPTDSFVSSDSWHVDALEEAIKAASRKSAAWCEDAAAKARSFHEEQCTAAGFHKRFSELVKKY